MLRPVRASRRALLVGGTTTAAAALIAACGVRDSGTTEPAAADPSAPAVDADSDLVTDVVAEIATALSLAKATAAAFPGLRPLGRRLTALHRSHLDELGQPADAKGGKVKGSADTGEARLLRSEEKLQGRLVEAALAAESGALAQVFASMAAAIAQQRAVAA